MFSTNGRHRISISINVDRNSFLLLLLLLKFILVRIAQCVVSEQETERILIVEQKRAIVLIWNPSSGGDGCFCRNWTMMINPHDEYEDLHDEKPSTGMKKFTTDPIHRFFYLFDRLNWKKHKESLQINVHRRQKQRTQIEWNNCLRWAIQYTSGHRKNAYS